MQSPSALRSPLWLALLAGSAFVSGCSESYSPLEMRAGLGVATVPLFISYHRGVEEWCDTGSKINPSGCRDSSERLTFRSASCGADCTVEDTGAGGRLRLTAARAGRYTVHLEVHGERSNEDVRAELEVEILEPTATELKVTAQISSAVGGTLYTALAEDGDAWLGLSFGERGTDRSIDFDPTSVVWSAEGAEITERDRSMELTGARAGQAVVTARLSDAVHGEARFDVLTPEAAMSTHVSTGRNFEEEPTLVELDPFSPSKRFYTALVDAAARRFPGGAERLRVEGEGCVLERLEADDFFPNANAAVRTVGVPAGGRCLLVVAEGSTERGIVVTRPSEDGTP